MDEFSKPGLDSCLTGTSIWWSSLLLLLSNYGTPIELHAAAAAYGLHGKTEELEPDFSAFLLRLLLLLLFFLQYLSSCHFGRECLTTYRLCDA